MRRALIVVGLVLTIAVPASAHAAEDTDPPVVQAAVLDPGSVDVSTSAQQVRATLRVTDASGVKAVSGTLESVDTGQATPLRLAIGIAGTPNDGYWRITFSLPQGAAPGAWRLGYTALDNAGNTVSSDDVPAETLPVVDVTSGAAPDVDGPELVSSTLDPASVEVGVSAQDVTATFHVTDATGTEHVLASLRSLADQATPNQQATLVSGTPKDGTWQTTYTIPRGAVAGEWRLSVLGMDDTLGNVSSGLFLPQEKLASVQVSSSHAPDEPADVHAVAADGQVTVSWSAPNDNGLPITSYVITSEPDGAVKTVGSDQTSVVFDGLVNGTEFRYSVVAVNAVGPSDPGYSEDATPNAVFETGPTATITGDLQVQSQLTAHEGTPSPEPFSYDYQWYADGEPIVGERYKKLELTEHEVGHRITVKVIAHRARYVDAFDLSDPTGVVTPGVAVAVAKPVVLAGRTVHVTATNLKPREPYTITIGGVQVKASKASSHGTVSAYVRVPRTAPEGWVKVLVTAASGHFDDDHVYAAHPATLTLVVTETTEHQNGAAQVLVYGVGPGEKVKVTYDGRTISPRGAVADLRTIDGEGFYRLIFPVGSKLGKHTIKVTGLSYSRRGSATLTVIP